MNHPENSARGYIVLAVEISFPRFFAFPNDLEHHFSRIKIDFLFKFDGG